MEFIRSSECANKPIQFFSAAASDNCRVQTLKVFMSESCKDRRKLMSTMFDWLAMISSEKATHARYKIQMVYEDANIIATALSTSPGSSRNYRWLCTKCELGASIEAVLTALKTTNRDRATKIVMTASTCVQTLGGISSDPKSCL